MVRAMIALTGLATAVLAPVAPARAEFFAVEQLRAMCRGDIAEETEFRTAAGHRLLAQVARERCRMYLLGLAEGHLQRIDPAARGRCLAEASATEVAEVLATALGEQPEAARGPAAPFVHAALRERYGCP